MTISSMSSTKSMKHLFLRPFYKTQMKGSDEGHLVCNNDKQKQTNRIWSFDLVKNSCNIRQDVTVPPSPPQSSKKK